MASLGTMPPIAIPPDELLPFGHEWSAEIPSKKKKAQSISRTPPYSSSDLTSVFDQKVGQALAVMLGGVPIIKPKSTALQPSSEDCVEVGECRVIGGIRPQNFDALYRPDGVRFAFDSKTLNDLDSVRKNYQNMINDLGTEATTVHIRFPYAVVTFLIAVPTPCLVSPQREALVGTLERLTSRDSPLDSPHKAEAIALVVWDPITGQIDPDWPQQGSPLRIEQFSRQVEREYVSRYKGLPPHAKD